MDQVTGGMRTEAPAEEDIRGWAALLRAPHGLRLAAVSAGIGLHAFNEVAIGPVLPIAVTALQGVALLPFVYAAFFVSVIMGGLTASPLRLRLGARRALLCAGLLYGCGVAVQAFAVGPLMLMAGRALQGLSDGWIVALCYTLIADLFPPRLVPRIFTAEAMVWALAAVLGPFAGGLSVEMLGWRWALTVSLPVIALFFAVMPFALPRDETRAPASPGAPRPSLLPPRLFSLTGTVGRGSWLLFLMTAAQSVSTVFLAYTLHVRLGLPPVRVGLVLITLSLSWSAAAIPIGNVDSLAKRQAILRAGPLLQATGALFVATGLFLSLLPLVLFGQMLNGIAFAMVFASANQAVIEDAAPEHRLATSALLPALETSGYVAGAIIVGGLGSLFAVQSAVAEGQPGHAVFALWGTAAILSLLSFAAARGVVLKLREA
jgi:predicted MFS family arabinose efflux permease